MIRLTLVGLIVGLSWLSALRANAQSVPYNPYAPVQNDAPAILPDGKLNWPAFFKSAKLENRFQAYFAMGSCTGTKKSIVDMLQQNKVDVNKLPEGSVTGRVVGVKPGLVMMVDSSGTAQTLVSHPAGVTKVEVAGKMSPVALRVGMTIRLNARVDEQGHGTKPVEGFDVITPTPDLKPTPVEADRTQTILGVVSRLDGDKLRLKIPTGKIHWLNFVVAPTTSIDVIGSSLDLIGVGDEISSTGRIYSGEGSLSAKTIFASKMTVKKSTGR